MHKHDVFQGLLVEDLDEKGILVACLEFELDDVTVHVVDVLVVQLLEELALELSAVLLLLELLLLELLLRVHCLRFNIKERLFFHGEVEL